MCVVTNSGRKQSIHQFSKKYERFPHFMHYHYLIHIENITINLKSSPETSEHFKEIVNGIYFLIAKPLTDVLKITDDLSSPYLDLILHTNICWLNCGDAVARVWKVFKEIKAYIS